MKLFQRIHFKICEEQAILQFSGKGGEEYLIYLLVIKLFWYLKLGLMKINTANGRE